ncbi:MAG: ATP-binding protein, partial [Mycobacteriaceae bacterium]
LDDDPAGARDLVVAAREASSRALEELRDLVRGIHPPVLADRGLADAVLALSLESVVQITVRSELPRRLLPSIESAAYFALSELLTNTAKHGAGSAEVTIEFRDGLLTAAVLDDGPGGADASRGTGLRGIARRLATFDGTMTVTSPVGGPTTVRLEVPCVLSSPKISSC